MSDTNIDPSKGQFIDPMFAVVIAAGYQKQLLHGQRELALLHGLKRVSSPLVM